MRKKLLSAFMVIMFVLSCGVLSACAGRYDKMQFEIQYAFKDEDGVVGDWKDADQTLSFNFGSEDDELVIDDNGNNLVFRVNIKNVKAKYIDDLMVYDSNTASSQVVKPNDEFTLNIKGAMQSSIRIYETKSSKETSFRLNVFESIKGVTTNDNYQAVVVAGKSVNLQNLISTNKSDSILLFTPEATNQTAVDFEIINAGTNLRYVHLDGDVLSIDPQFTTEFNPVVTIKATSRFNEEITTEFKVFVIDELAKKDMPIITDETGKAIENKENLVRKLFVNDRTNNEYKTVIGVDMSGVNNATDSSQYVSKYVEGVEVAAGKTAKYTVKVYVDGELIDLDAYDDHNGIRIQPIESTDPNNQYVSFYEITADDKSFLTYPTNTVKFELSIDGLNCEGGVPRFSADLKIEKSTIVEAITVNGVEASTTEGENVLNIYSTQSSSQTATLLTLDVLPNDNKLHTIYITTSESVEVTDKTGKALPSSNQGLYIWNGETVRVGFKTGATNFDNQTITFSTRLKDQNNAENFSVTYQVKKVVTADSFSVYVKDYSSEANLDDYTTVSKNMLINANLDLNVFYLKINYTGQTLETKSIDLSIPSTSKFAFANGARQINLGTDMTSAGINLTSSGGNDDGSKYVVYSVPIKGTREKVSAEIAIFAGKNGANSLVEATFNIEAVFVADEDIEFVVRTEGQNITSFDSGENNDTLWFATINNANVKSELHFGQNIGGVFDERFIKNVRLIRKSDSVNSVGSMALGSFNNANKYQIWGVTTGTTSFVANISYYAIKDGEIKLVEEDNGATIDIDVAVFNRTSDIDLSFALNSNREIVYINEKYEDAAKATINFSTKGSPSTGVSFGDTTITEVEIGGVKYKINELKLSCFGGYESVLINGQQLRPTDVIDLTGLNGQIEVKLNGESQSTTQYVTLTVSAYSFGKQLLSKNITINFGSYTPSSNISVSGDALVNNNNTPYIYLSFLNVADGGYAQAHFNASVEYSQTGSARYDDLDYQIYEIQRDDNGVPRLNDGDYVLNLSQNAFYVDITKAGTEQGVSIRAYKANGGGMFLLRIMAKDSYLVDNSGNGIYTNYQDIFISITDGSVTDPYRISTQADFENIKNDLSANYVLANNLTVSNHKTFGSFMGSLSGQEYNYSKDGSAIETERRVLTITIAGQAESMDNTYFGVFAKLTGIATVKNLVLNVKFIGGLNIVSTAANRDLYIGGLAGIVEAGATIENVEFNVNLNNIELTTSNVTTDSFIGGIAGQLNCVLDLTTSQVKTTGKILASVASTSQVNIGGVAGSVLGRITGNYTTPNSLVGFNYNVGVNILLSDQDTSAAATAINNIRFGAVAGILGEGATISNLVVVGKMVSEARTMGYMAGVAGEMLNDSTISNIVLLGLDAEVKEGANTKLAGVAGIATKANITNVKFMAYRLEDLIDTDLELTEKSAHGQLNNIKGVVAGIAAEADEATQINKCSVENYVKTGNYENLRGNIVYGIANNGEISLCYVSANVWVGDVNATDNKFFTITESGTVSDSYFVGKVSTSEGTDANIDSSKASYSIVNYNGLQINGVNFDPKDYFTAASVSLNEGESPVGYYTTADITTAEKITDPNYAGEIYKFEFDRDKWEAYARSLADANWTEGNAFGNWTLDESYNIVRLTLAVGNVDFYFPVLTDVYTLIPNDILASLNKDKIKELNSLYVDNFTRDEDTDQKDEFDQIIKHQITETVIVNYFNDKLNPLNNYNLNRRYILDLITLTITPNGNNTMGGIMFKILRGSDYAALINTTSGWQIYFKGVTGGSDYILIKAYSLLNPDACDYFLIYTQYLYTDLSIEGDDVYTIGNEFHLDTYKGQKSFEFTLAANNISTTNSACSSLFDVKGIENYVEISATTSAGNDRTRISVDNTSMFNRFNVTIFEQAQAEELVAFTARLNLTAYFGEAMFPKVGELPQYLVLGTKTVVISISETATDLEFTTDNLEGESKETFTIGATLSTGFVDKNAVDSTKPVNFELKGNNIVSLTEENHDSLVMQFRTKSGQAELERLLSQAQVADIVHLFDFDIQNTFNKNLKTYTYRILLKLKEDYNHRYLTSSITFGIKIWAASNPNIDGGTEIDLTINPSSLSTTIVMNNYAATSAEAMNSYTHLITSSQVETASITPGGNGGVLTIQLQPSYAYVSDATLKSSELFVPSLNQNVKARFEQLVYHTGLKKYISITPVNQATSDGMGIHLKFATQTDDGVNYTYDGTIYIHVVLEQKFSGLMEELRLTLDVYGANNSHIQKTKTLVTDFLPGVTLQYDSKYETKANIEGKDVKGYLIQQNTANNIITLNIYGYQFNTSPVANISWLNGGDEGVNQISKIVHKWENAGQALTPNADGSYTMRLALDVKSAITKPFKVEVSMNLLNGTVATSESSELVFFPTDYLLNMENSQFGFGSNLDLAINQARDLTFSFATNSTSIDYSPEIYSLLIDTIKENLKSKAENNDLTEAQLAAKVYEELKKQFSYSFVENGNVAVSSFDKTTSKFRVTATNYGEQTVLRIVASEVLEAKVEFKVYYNYEFVSEDGVNMFKLKFGLQNETQYPYTFTIDFNMNFFNQTTRQDAFAISSAEQMFDANGNCLLGEGQNYVLTNDIVVELAKPITTAIASLDGNNKKITIKKFVVDTTSQNDSTAGYFGLFATVGEGTLLYNLVVDYSQFNAKENGQLAAVGENLTDIVFGGLAAVNNGLIYNCDVVNANGASTKVVNLLVNDSSTTTVTFGGLVGINNGTITNSRVGRSRFTKIVADDYSQTSYEQQFGALNFVVGNRTTNLGQGFKSIIGGFVGINNANNAISSSYVANTGLYTYSTNQESELAGFVAENSGKISYSYVKSLESTIANGSAFSTGAKIEAFADGNIAGFVYENKNGANINNCFANTELVSKSAFMAGFVLQNDNGARIAQCYAACTFANADGDTTLQITPEQPFVGADAQNGLLSYGELVNCYWYKDTTKQKFILAEDDTKSQAVALDATNFKDTTNLVNFVFVLSDSRNDRDQGIWSYYDNQNNSVSLPELTIANNVAHSFRYEVGSDEETGVSKYTYATKFALRSKANPEIISSAAEFNSVFKPKDEDDNAKFQGYVRFIADIDFGSSSGTMTAINTRKKFTLGGDAGNSNSVSGSFTSIAGNGMEINNVYLDVGSEAETATGLFANIDHAYIKNLNINFQSTSNSETGRDGAFSTANVVYSGGLAGKITDSVIINITLNGNSTTLQGANLVGGLAGIIDGESLIYGVSSNLSVVTNHSAGESIYDSSKKGNIEYIKTLSYAGGIAGVVDLKTRSYSNENYNFSYLYINSNNVSANANLKLTADYAGGVAGYVGEGVKALRLYYNVGNTNRIKGQHVAGGLFALSMGASVEASKVSAEDSDDAQFSFDKAFAAYVLDMSKGLDSESIGNTGLIESYNYAGGLIGYSVNSTVFSCYSKASFYAGKIIGGLVGYDRGSSITYDYAVPYLNFVDGKMSYAANSQQSIGLVTTVGGLIGQVDRASNNSGVKSYTFSTILADDQAYATFKAKAENKDRDIKFDYVIGSNSVYGALSQVYSGRIGYTNLGVTENISGTITTLMSELYNLDNPDVQLTVYNKIFSIWDNRYWNLETNSRYFPLLTDERDENYEIISQASDFGKLRNNPSGSFKIVDDINMQNYVGQSNNFVFDFLFEGVLVGGKPDGSSPIVYNLKINATDPGNAGLFKSTNTATFRNIEFSWADGGVGASGKKVDIDNFGGFSCDDTNSKINNIQISVGRNANRANSNNADLFNASCTSINMTGFGGLIASGVGSSIYNSSFSGYVGTKATISISNNSGTNSMNFGGLVGFGGTDPQDTENTMSIMNSMIGDLLPTQFKFSVGSSNAFNFGMLAGSIERTAVSSNSVGDLNATSESRRKVLALITLKERVANTVVSGLIGENRDSHVEGNTSLNKIVLTGDYSNTAANAAAYVAGLIGRYQLSNANSGRQISRNKVDTEISTSNGNNSTLTLNKNMIYASAGVASSETQNEVQFVQDIFIGSITTNGNAIVGAVVGAAYSGNTTGEAQISLREVVSNVEITANFGIESIKLGGVAGEVQGKLTLTNDLFLGRVIPQGGISSENNQTVGKYLIGGLVGDMKDVLVTSNTYSYNLVSILSGGILGKANVKDDERQIGALYGNVKAGGKFDGSTDNLFYSTDIALVPQNNPIGGKNMAYSTLLRTRPTGGSVWVDTADSTSSEFKLPYIQSMLEAMQQFNIMQGNNYVQGLAVKPRVNYNTTSESEKTYYLVDSLNTSGSVKGIFVGSGNSISSFSVGTLASGSAISNFHVEYADNTTINNALVNENNGTVFNCSVNGSITASQQLGLIVNVNRGLVAYCYSSADVAATNIAVGGIVNLNYNLIDSCYFTGTITITQGSDSHANGYGIAQTQTGSFMYNCYMAGNINHTYNNNSMVYNGGGEGANNYIDTLATPTDQQSITEYDENNEKVAYINKTLGIKPISTYALMNATNLNGSWMTALVDGKFQLTADSEGNYNSSFSYNYNYPVFNFNKWYSATSDSMTIELPTLHSRKTGNGIVDASIDNPFQIHTLAVLSSVQALVANGDASTAHYNFKLTRDLNGYVSGEGISAKFANWLAVGRADANLGFALANKFQGVFDGSGFTIENVSGQGLFTNINGATIKNLKLGEFRVKDSGAIGVLVNGNLTVETVDTSSAKVSGESVAVLFGQVEEGNIIISNLKTDTGSGDNGPVATVTLTDNESSYGGFIASKMSGGSITLCDQQYRISYVGSSGNGSTMGGLVGLMSSGSINSSASATLYMSLTTHEWFGGLIGKSIEGSNQSSEDSGITISNFTIVFTNSEVKVNKLGVLVGNGEAGSVTIKQCNFKKANSLSGLTNKFVNGDNRYFGYVAAKIKDANINYASGSVENMLFTMEPSGDAPSSKESQGFGSLVGSMSGGSLTVKVSVPMRLAVDNCYNLGGLIGYYKSGTLAIGGLGQGSNGSKEAGVELQGYMNVGGAIGYLAGELQIASSGTEESSTNFMSSGVKFATLRNDLMTYSSNKLALSNWGGLVGYSAAEISGAKNANEIYLCVLPTNMSVTNVGGVVGLADEKISNSTNQGSIHTIYNKTSSADTLDGELNVADSNSYDVYFSISSLDGEKAYATMKSYNVGGVAGQATGEVENCANSAEIQGFKNVGGIVGLLKGSLNNFKTLDTSEIADNSTLGVDCYTIEGNILSENQKDEIINKENTYYTYGNETGGIVFGVSNVGGAVGKAENASIKGVSTRARVYGNNNVGGLVGLAAGSGADNNATIVGNIVGGKISSGSSEGETSVSAQVKATLYRELKRNSNTNTNMHTAVYTMPTSVGGLLGATENGIIISSNSVNVAISSTDEGLDSDDFTNYNAGANNYPLTKGENLTESSTVISTIKNNIYNNAEDKVSEVTFNNMETGFGGFIGTTDGSTVLKNANNTIYIATNKVAGSINAPIGINVGTFYGYYKDGTSISTSVGSSGEVKYQHIELPNLLNEFSVSGAYNIGGAVGYFDHTDQNQFKYSWTPEKVINVQPENIGMYVGGFAGKFKNNISELQINKFNKDLNIKITTKRSYYLGGLIGRLEGNMGNLKDTKTEVETGSKVEGVDVVGDKKSNFGGLVGMLKVEKSTTSTKGVYAWVGGTHEFAFTVNTIENENYIDGETMLNADKDNNKVELYAQAYYINQDTFIISSSKGNFIESPINQSNGWHKDYTAFRVIQRCIPAEDNKQEIINDKGNNDYAYAGWDSISIIYDAGNIMGVGTNDNGDIAYTIYEEEPNMPKLYCKYGIGVIILSDQGKRLKATQGNSIYGNFPDESNFSLNDKNHKEFHLLNVGSGNSIDYNETVTTDGVTYYAKRYYISAEYKGTDYAFGLRTVYDSDATAKSGSIFEVDGYTHMQPTMGAREAKINMILSIIGEVVGGLIMVACLIIPGTQFIAGLISVTLFGLGAVGLGVSYSYRIMYAKQLQQIQSSNTYYLASTNQSKGYLASLNSREMTYKLDEDGKVVNVSSSGYTYEDADIDKYYVKFSTVRPSDYYQHSYCRIVGTAENKITDEESAKQAILAATEIDMCVMPTGNVNWAENDKFGYDLTGSYGTAYFMNYLYKDGYYWKCSLAGIVKHNRVNTSLFETVNGSAQIAAPKIYREALTYVAGQYSADGGYSYVSRYGNHLTYENGIYSIDGNQIYDKKSPANETGQYENPEVDVKLKFKYEEDINYDTDGKIEGYDYIQGVYYTVKGKKISGVAPRYAQFIYSENQPAGTLDVDYVIGYYNEIGYQEVDTDTMIDGQTYYILINGEHKDFIYSASGGNPSKPYYTKTLNQKHAYFAISSVEETLKEGWVIGRQIEGEHKSISELVGKSIVLEINPECFENPYYKDDQNSDNCNYNLVDKNNSPLSKAKNGTAYFSYTTTDSDENTISQTAKYYLWQGGYVYTDGVDGKVLFTAETTPDDQTITIIEDKNALQPLQTLLNNWNTYNGYYTVSNFERKVINKVYSKKTIDGKEVLVEKDSNNQEQVVSDLTKEIIITSSANNFVEITYGDLRDNLENNEKEYGQYYVGTEKVSNMFKLDTTMAEKHILCSINITSLTYGFTDDDNNTTGLLYEASFKMGDEGVVDYNYNMFISSPNLQLYTRYKYNIKFNDKGQFTSNLESVTWTDDKGEEYKVVPNPLGSIYVNNGFTTYLVERVMVTLSSDKSLKYYINNSSKDSELSDVSVGGIVVQ